MTFWYTACAAFGPNVDDYGLCWEKYIQRSKLTNLQEVVSLDGIINKLLVEPDYNSSIDWDHIVVDNEYQTGFFTTLDYVLSNIEEPATFNLLAVVVNPKEDCNPILLKDFEFAGYDLLDKQYGNSAITNCGGFDETFTPNDLNTLGLLPNYHNALDIQERLFLNNPGERHANTNVIAIWRHKIIGRRTINGDRQS